METDQTISREGQSNKTDSVLNLKNEHTGLDTVSTPTVAKAAPEPSIPKPPSKETNITENSHGHAQKSPEPHHNTKDSMSISPPIAAPRKDTIRRKIKRFD